MKFPIVKQSIALAAILVLISAHSSLAKNWLEAIAETEARADYYWDYGKAHGAYTGLGAAYNELDVPRHECAIAGRMLGKSTVIAHLEEMPEPTLNDSMSPEDVQALMYYSLSLENWAMVAKNLLVKTEDEVKQVWNLNCVGRQGIPESEYVQLSSSFASFRIDGSDTIILGDIQDGFADELDKWLQDHPETKRIVLGSGGGNVVEAMRAGFIIRGMKLDTTLSDYCYSACPLVFLGGVNRTIWSPYPLLGFHQISDGSGKSLPTSHDFYTLIEKYVNTMGADSDFFLASMLRASPSEMFEPDLEALCENKVTTWVQRLCF